MMHTFLCDHRQELVERCEAKVAGRRARRATDAQLRDGIPLFLDQLVRALRLEEDGQDPQAAQGDGPPGGPARAQADAGASAFEHGSRLLELGYSIDQVVHDYGDVCEAIADFAVERGAPFGVREFRTLNRCLDSAIAQAVTAFSAERDLSAARAHSQAANEKVGSLAHELRNGLLTASLAIAALEQSRLPLTSATGSLLKRSIQELKDLVGAAIQDVREESRDGPFLVAEFIGEAAATAQLYAEANAGQFRVDGVGPDLQVRGNRGLLLAALGNILQNAFKFTRPGTLVHLGTHVREDHVDVEVADHCGGLPDADSFRIRPFAQAGADRSGLGLGLSIALRSVESQGGELQVRNLPGVGCVFTIRLPLAGAAAN